MASIWGIAQLTAASLVALAALAGCTIQDPVAGPTASPSNEPPVQSDDAHADPAAVVSLAAIDVDGVNATVAGFVTELVEDGGTCEFVLSRDAGGAPVTVGGPSHANVGTTSCGTYPVPLTQLERGSWTVVLHYESDNLELESEPLALEVP